MNPSEASDFQSGNNKILGNVAEFLATSEVYLHTAELFHLIETAPSGIPPRILSHFRKHPSVVARPGFQEDLHAACVASVKAGNIADLVYLILDEPELFPHVSILFSHPEVNGELGKYRDVLSQGGQVFALDAIRRLTTSGMESFEPNPA